MQQKFIEYCIMQLPQLSYIYWLIHFKWVLNQLDFWKLLFRAKHFPKMLISRNLNFALERSTLFMPLVSFYTKHWKHEKNKFFTGYRKKPLAWTGSKKCRLKIENLWFTPDLKNLYKLFNIPLTFSRFSPTIFRCLNLSYML